MSVEKKCPHCHNTFTTSNKQQKYCSEKCRSAKGWEAHKKRKKEKKDNSQKYFRFEDFGGNLLI